MERKRLYAVLSGGFLASSLILNGGGTLAQVGQPLQQMPPPPIGTVQPPQPPSVETTPYLPKPIDIPSPSLEKKLAPPAEAEKKKLAPPAEAEKKKLAPRLNCGPGWRPVGEMSCEAVKPILQCPPGTNYFERKFLVGCSR